MFCRLLVVDMKCGILDQWKKYLLAILFFFTCSVIFVLQWKNQERALGEALGVTPTLGDFFLFFFGGSDRYVFDPYRPFIFPAQWILMILYGTYLNLNYANDNLHGIGIHALLHSKSRSMWWFSKCSCVIVGTLIYFILSILTTAFSCFILGGEFSMEIHASILQTILEVFSMQMQNPLGEMVITYIMVYLVIVALSLLQLLLSILIKPLLSFLSISTIVFVSSYFMTPLLFANFAMPVRSLCFVTDGLDPGLGFVLIGSSIIFCLLSGWWYFNHIDILGKEE